MLCWPRAAPGRSWRVRRRWSRTRERRKPRASPAKSWSTACSSTTSSSRTPSTPIKTATSAANNSALAHGCRPYVRLPDFRLAQGGGIISLYPRRLLCAPFTQQPAPSRLVFDSSLAPRHFFISKAFPPHLSFLSLLPRAALLCALSVLCPENQVQAPAP